MANPDLIATDETAQDDTRAKRNVAVLVLAQAVLGAQMPMVFTVGGLAGTMLTPNPCLATLPLTMVVLGSMTTAPWLSTLMQRTGRVPGFIVGALGGALGGMICAWALWTGSFMLFLIGSYLTGIYMSAQGFFRFAATDTASAHFRPKAISYVMAGGLLSALIGPPIATGFADSFVVHFVGTYIAIFVLNALGLFLFFLLDIPKPEAAVPGVMGGRTRRELLREPQIVVAMICAMVAYALMNLVMTSTPLAVVGCGFSTDQAGYVVSAHVFAMFAPSFVTGHLINRFGTARIVWLGLAILAAAGGVALQGVALENFFVALVLLGIGWNFAFIGATTMLAEAHTSQERGAAQGLNDMVVFGCVTMASLASGGLMNCAGADAVAGWSAVNLAMLPFLALAGGALIWMSLRPQTA